MSSREYIRWGGLALLVGGVIPAIGVTVQSFESPASSLWIPTILFTFFGIVLGLLGLPVLYAVLARAIGALGLVGYVLVFVSGILTVVGGTGLALVLPYMAQHIPGFMTTVPPPPVTSDFLAVGGIIRLIGGLLFGAALVRARTPERYAGMLLILGAILSYVGGIINSAPHLGDLGRVMFILALGWMGWTLMTQHVAEMEPSRAPAEGPTGAHARA